MKPRQVIVYMVIFAVLGIAYYVFEVRPTARANKTEATRVQLFDVSPQRITGFDLVVRDIKFRVVRSDKDAWRLLSPVETPGDRDAIDELIHGVLNARKQRAILKPGPMSEYRLDPATISLTFMTESKAETVPLRLGDMTPTGDACYGRLGDSAEVFTVEPGLYGLLSRTLYDLRDKSLVITAVENIDRLVIHGPEVIDLRKKGVRSWEIARPESLPADESAVERLLYAGLKNKALRFVALDQARNTGLETPAWSMDVFADGRKEAEVTLGNAWTSSEAAQAPEQTPPAYWVKSTQHPEVLVVESKAVSALQTGLFDLMERHVLNLDFRNLSAVNLIKGEARIEAEKIRNIWDILEPAHSADGDRRITRLIAAMADLKYIRQLDGRPETVRRCGLDAPDLSITMKGPEEEATLHVGLSPIEDKYLPVRVGSGSVMLINPDDLLPALPGDIGPVTVGNESADK